MNLRALRDPSIYCPTVYTRDRTRDFRNVYFEGSPGISRVHSYLWLCFDFLMINFIQPQRSLLSRQWWMLVIRNLWRKKIRKNTLKRIPKAKIISAIHPDGSNARISNYIKLLINSMSVLILQEDLNSP